MGKLKKAILLLMLIALPTLSLAGELEDKQARQGQIERAILVIRIQREYLNRQFKELGKELKALRWDLQQIQAEIRKLQENKADEKSLSPDS